MSGIRSRDSPARQNTTYENYHNHGLHINTSEGTVNYQTIINNRRPSDPLRMSSGSLHKLSDLNIN